MPKKDFQNWSKEKLLHEYKELSKRKKFGIVWEDKIEEVAEQCKTSLPVLKDEKSKSFSTGKNGINHIFIEGDNYHALSVLNYTHKKKIDVIYIDPPYNTGNHDFIYNDNYVDKDDRYRHSKWLSFMSKRLRLAKNLLKDDGIICISIDENEYAQLKLLCDEIFNEANRIATHHIQVRYADKTLNEKNDWQPVMEYVLIYARNGNLFKANKPTVEYSIDKFIYEIKELTKGIEIIVKNRKVTIFKKGEWKIIKYKIPRKDLLKETWVSGSIYSGTGNGTMVQSVIEPRIKIDGYGSLYKIDRLGEDGLGYRYFTGPQKTGATRSKMYSGVPLFRAEELNNGEAVKHKSIMNYYDFSPDFGNIRHEGGVSFNSGKKPIKMLKQFINYHKNNKAIVLDFFAGSGTTGHAVLELNKEDGGKRQFILCTDNQDNNGSGTKIASDICYPRIKKVMSGYSIGGKKIAGLGDNLRYYSGELVGNIKTDNDKRVLTSRSTEMLCLAEATFDEVASKNGLFTIYENQKQMTGIIFDEDAISDFKKEARKHKKPIIVYVFSYDHTYNEEDFEDLENLKVVKPIPEVILNVYGKIYKKLYKPRNL